MHTQDIEPAMLIIGRFIRKRKRVITLEEGFVSCLLPNHQEK